MRLVQYYRVERGILTWVNTEFLDLLHDIE